MEATTGRENDDKEQLKDEISSNISVKKQMYPPPPQSTTFYPNIEIGLKIELIPFCNKDFVFTH